MAHRQKNSGFIAHIPCDRPHFLPPSWSADFEKKLLFSENTEVNR